jgi:hypothetical protein
MRKRRHEGAAADSSRRMIAVSPPEESVRVIGNAGLAL